MKKILLYLLNMKILNPFQIILVMSIMDLKLKYQNSALGFLWSFIKPLMQFLVYYIIFSKVLKTATGHDYALRLFFGVLIWAWFSEATNLGLNAFLGKRSIITKIKTNKTFPIISSYLTPTMNYSLNFLIFIATYLVLVKAPPEHVVSLPHFLVFIYSMTCISMFIVSMNFILANLNVLYRDMQPIWELVLTYGIFLTPIIYQIPVPEKYETLYYSVNLLALPLANLKSVFFSDQLPMYTNMTLMLSHLTVLLCLFGASLWTHHKISDKVVDFL